MRAERIPVLFFVSTLLFAAVLPIRAQQCEASLTLRDDGMGINWVNLGPVATPLYVPTCNPLNSLCWEGPYASGSGQIYGNGKVLGGVIDTHVRGATTGQAQARMTAELLIHDVVFAGTGTETYYARLEYDCDFQSASPDNFYEYIVRARLGPTPESGFVPISGVIPGTQWQGSGSFFLGPWTVSKGVALDFIVDTITRRNKIGTGRCIVRFPTSGPLFVFGQNNSPADPSMPACSNVCGGGFMQGACAIGPGQASPPQTPPLTIGAITPSANQFGAIDLSIQYSPACGAVDHNVHIGRLDDLRANGAVTWSSAQCGIGITGAATVTLPEAENSFFIVAGTDDAFLEGHYGQQRPPHNTCGELLELTEATCDPP